MTNRPAEFTNWIFRITIQCSLVIGFGSSAANSSERLSPDDMQRLISQLVDDGKIARESALLTIANSRLAFDLDPRTIPLLRAEPAYESDFRTILIPLKETRSVLRDSLIASYDLDSDNASACAGMLLAAFCDHDEKRLLQKFALRNADRKAKTSGRLAAYAGLLVGHKHSDPVMGSILRAWSMLSVKQRCEIWQKLERGNLRDPANDDDEPLLLSLIDDKEFRPSILLPGINKLGHAGVCEATIVVGLGRGFSEASDILRATMDDFPVDIRCFAIGMCGHHRIARLLGERRWLIRLHLNDKCRAVRIAAAKVLYATRMLPEGSEGIVAREIAKDVMGEDEMRRLEDALRGSREEFEGWTDAKDLVDSPGKPLIGRNDGSLLNDIKFIFAFGNAGQRRLEVIRIFECAMSIERSAAFRQQVFGALQGFYVSETDQDVIVELKAALNYLQPFLKYSFPFEKNCSIETDAK